MGHYAAKGLTLSPMQSHQAEAPCLLQPHCLVRKLKLPGRARSRSLSLATYVLPFATNYGSLRMTRGARHHFSSRDMASGRPG